MPLSEYELRYAEERLGRRLTREEAALLEAEWSEHCSYKSTRRLLSRLPTRAPWVLVGPGRDAGAVKLFDDVALVARIESHNHPSAVDPYNGAATGVGGIIRDVLSLGARPVMLLDALYLGDPSSPRARWLARNIVRGISDYGNRVGIPTAAGYTWFSPSYNNQPLVNVACIGVVHPSRILEGRVEPGDVIVLAGNTTGRDGLLGSSFASKPLGGDEEDLAAIQVGNPFLEKLLIDALTEAFQRGILRHVKDLGGGGLATATVETAASSGVGFVVHLDRVHLREHNLTPAEILVSESQERMLLVPRRGRLGDLLAVLDKYSVEYSVIGYFTGDGRVRFLYRGIPVVDLPVELAANPPLPERGAQAPPPPPELPPLEGDVREILLNLLARPNVGSKRFVYEKYDWGVGGRTVGQPGYYDAAVAWLRDGTVRGFAAAVAGNPRYTRLDPFRGAALSLLEAYRRVAAVGAEPLAALDNVNSGNPEKPEQHGYTARIIEGLAWAASGVGVPFIGGNVSLYNEDSRGNMIDPVASVLVVGRIRDVSKALPNALHCGGLIVAAGETRPELGGSEAAEAILGRPAGEPPEPRPEDERRLARLAAEAASRGLACSAHSVGLGGLLVAVAKMAVRGGVGVEVDLSRACSGCSPLEAAFSETPARMVFEVPPGRLDEFLEAARSHGVPAAVIGRATGGEVLEVRFAGSGFTVGLEEAGEAYESALRALEGVA
ncbi:phosphoribosylformylglycinamidine synthase subunit PurL [Stetteria hydrogenophila]